MIMRCYSGMLQWVHKGYHIDEKTPLGRRPTALLVWIDHDDSLSDVTGALDGDSCSANGHAISHLSASGYLHRRADRDPWGDAHRRIHAHAHSVSVAHCERCSDLTPIPHTIAHSTANVDA